MWQQRTLFSGYSKCNDILRKLFLLLGVPLESQEEMNDNETDPIDNEDSMNDVPECSFPVTKVTGETAGVRYAIIMNEHICSYMFNTDTTCPVDIKNSNKWIEQMNKSHA